MREARIPLSTASILRIAVLLLAVLRVGILSGLILLALFDPLLAISSILATLLIAIVLLLGHGIVLGMRAGALGSQ